MKSIKFSITIVVIGFLSIAFASPISGIDFNPGTSVYTGIEHIIQGRNTLEVYVDPIVLTTVTIYDSADKLMDVQSSSQTGWLIFDTTGWPCDTYTIIGEDLNYEKEFEEVVCPE